MLDTVVRGDVRCCGFGISVFKPFGTARCTKQAVLAKARSKSARTANLLEVADTCSDARLVVRCKLWLLDRSLYFLVQLVLMVNVLL